MNPNENNNKMNNNPIEEMENGIRCDFVVVRYFMELEIILHQFNIRNRIRTH